MAEASETHAARSAPARLERWRASAEAGLRGKRFEDQLVSRTAEGLEIQPLYADDAAAVPLSTRREPTWDRREALDASEVEAAIARMQRATQFGINGFQVIGHAQQDEARLIGAARERKVSLHFPAACDGANALDRLNEGLVGSQRIAVAKLSGALLDAWRGADKVCLLHQASSAPEQERGAGEQLQLALCLWRAVRWLRGATCAGWSLEEASGSFEFELSLGCDVFLEISKLRALRLLWQKVLVACDGPAHQPAHLHARTSLRSWTERDPWVNALRGTTIAFAAATGGADSILIAPYDALLGRPEEDAARLACNTHAILAHEAHIDALEDPAAGSGALESLTQSLAAGAWGLFQKLESTDGAQARAWIDHEIRRTAQVEARAIATRRQAIVGVSEFANLAETIPTRQPGIGEDHDQRLARPFELLRDLSDARLERCGERPKAFLANIGTELEFRARSDFACGLLAAGGIEALNQDGFRSAADALEAHRASGAKLVVLASSDERYAEFVPRLAKELHARGACVLVVSRPGQDEPAWRAAGVAHFIYRGCDALELLTQLHASGEA